MLTTEAFLLTTGAFFFLLLASTSMDCKQESSTVSKKASPLASNLVGHLDVGGDWACKTPSSHAWSSHGGLNWSISIICKHSSPRPSVKCRFRCFSAAFYLFDFFCFSVPVPALECWFYLLKCRFWGLKCRFCLLKMKKWRKMIKMSRKCCPSIALNNTNLSIRMFELVVVKRASRLSLSLSSLSLSLSLASSLEELTAWHQMVDPMMLFKVAMNATQKAMHLTGHPLYTPLCLRLIVARAIRNAIRANRFARIIRNWDPYFYSTSGRFARITRISDSRESPDSRESCESIRANHATKLCVNGSFWPIAIQKPEGNRTYKYPLAATLKTLSSLLEEMIGDHQPHTATTKDFGSKKGFQRGWCTNCQNLREQQNVYHPQDCTGDVHHGFCGGGARIVGFEMILILLN